MSPATCYLCAMKARENKYRSDWTLNNKMRKTWGNKPGQPIPTVLVLSHSSLSITKRVSFDKIRLMVLLRKHKPGRWPPPMVKPASARALWPRRYKIFEPLFISNAWGGAIVESDGEER